MTSPRDFYQGRLSQYQTQLAILDLQLDRVGTARVGVAISGVAFAAFVLGLQLVSLWWLIAPVLLLIALSIRKSHFLAKRDALRHAAAFHQRGLDRLDQRWMGKGDQGTRFADENHLYAADLDLFGS